MPPILTALALLALAVAAQFLARRQYAARTRRAGLPYPPPAPAAALPANVKRPWIALFNAWRAQPSADVMAHRAGDLTEVYIMSARAATDLLDKRSVCFSSRPRAIFAFELATRGQGLALCPYNDRFRKNRRLMQQSVGQSRVAEYDSIAEREVQKLMDDFRREPQDFYQNVLRYSASFTLDVVYNRPITKDDPLIKAIDVCNTAFFEAGKTGSTLDKYPWLLWLPRPFSPWLRLADECFERELGLFRGLLRDYAARSRPHENHAATGSPTAAAQTMLSRGMQEMGLSEGEASYVAGGMFAAGADTMAHVVLTFVIASASQAHDFSTPAREELAACLRGHEPSEHSLCIMRAVDEGRLPLVRAIVLECLRWRPFAPMGAPHATTQDEVYQGCFIPKGSTVFSNIWSISRDPEVWDRAEDFIPQRYLPGSELRRTEAYKETFAFGFGRRSCPGQAISMRLLVYTLALLLLHFDFLPPAKSDGSPGEKADIDTMNYRDSGLVTLPRPFQCEIRARTSSPDEATVS